jgi:hypothetical protein
VNTRERIMDAITKAGRQGLKIATGEWGVEQGLDGTWKPFGASVCALGAVLLAEQPTIDSVYCTNARMAAMALGESYFWAEEFVEGFDAWSEGETQGVGGYKEAVEVRQLLPLLPECLELAEEDAPAFWQGAEAMYRLMQKAKGA